ncbi:MAG: phosphogluconate dehydrogenase (NAD(+)-dependent, decarboxylating) [Enterococcus sp.]
MQIAFIGLGKMGMGIAQNSARQGNFTLLGTDKNDEVQETFEAMGGKFFKTLPELLQQPGKKIVWVMLPAGEKTNQVIEECLAFLTVEDTLIDAGNSKYTDTLLNAQKCQQVGISFLDVGTSGGVKGAQSGACMMVGGAHAVFLKNQALFQALCVPEGYLYCGDSGSGHYLKMVHNGIEYGMMQSIAEGFHLLHHSAYHFDLEQVAHVFNHGSVIRAWLMELTENIFSEKADFTMISSVIPSSGEGMWTVEEALQRKVALPVITQSLMTRYMSADTEQINEKIIALLRNQFGGHAITKEGG